MLSVNSATWQSPSYSYKMIEIAAPPDSQEPQALIGMARNDKIPVIELYLVG
jgi:hypothetical protein